MKRTYILSIYLLSLLLLSGCDKLKLQKDASLDAIDAGSNLKEMTISQYLSIDHSNDKTSLNLFAEAVKRAGLSELLNSSEAHTIIFLNNDAVTAMVSSLGYQTVAQVPPVVLKYILSDLIFKGKVHSTDLAIGETKKYETINSDFVYLSREQGTADNYVFYVNKSSEIISPSVLVRTQNLDFSNGTAHVITQFTYYRLNADAQDAAAPGGVGTTENLYVGKDVHVQNGNASRNVNYNDVASIDIKNTNGVAPEADRRAYFQYPLTTPSFGKRIGSAKLNVYVYLTGLTSTTKFTLSAYQGADVDWTETAITWVNAPTFNPVALNSAIVSGAQTGWVSMDITAAVSELYSNNKTFMNVVLNHNVDNFIRIRPKEFSSGLYRSYISVTSPPPTILTAGNLSPVVVSAASGIKVLGLDNLKMNGTADKNVYYTVTQVPAKGYLIRYGVPLAVNAGFSQADVAKGAVKFLYNGTSTGADRVVLEARDNNGGYYPTLLNLGIEIQ